MIKKKIVLLLNINIFISVLSIATFAKKQKIIVCETYKKYVKDATKENKKKEFIDFWEKKFLSQYHKIFIESFNCAIFAFFIFLVAKKTIEGIEEKKNLRTLSVFKILLRITDWVGKSVSIFLTIKCFLKQIKNIPLFIDFISYILSLNNQEKKEFFMIDIDKKIIFFCSLIFREVVIIMLLYIYIKEYIKTKKREKKEDIILFIYNIIFLL